MPYRRAHLWLLLLFPVAVLAFWPGYFGVLGRAPIAFHVHAGTASAWIALLAFQLWSIHARHNALHRSAGLGVFAVLPLFVAGGLLVMQTMAGKFAAQADPFNGAFGARLRAVDAVATVAVLGFVYEALRQRRHARRHAAHMLATVLFMLSPAFGRLLPLMPGFPMDGLAGRHPFEVAFHLAQLIAIGIALGLYRSAGREGRPFLVAAGLIGLQTLLFETLGRSEPWQHLFVALPALAPATLAATGVAASLLVLSLGWTRVPSAPRAGATA